MGDILTIVVVAGMLLHFVHYTTYLPCDNWAPQIISLSFINHATGYFWTLAVKFIPSITVTFGDEV